MRENEKYHCDFHDHHNPEGSKSLSELLDRCGHYYAHRVKGSRRGQDSVLLCLAQHSDLTQKELVEKLGITPASLSEVLMKLERKGYVVREKDENDRRLVRVQVTRAGRDALTTSDSETDDPFKVLSSEEQDILAQTLSKLLADWEAHYVGSGRHHHGHGHSAHEKKHFDAFPNHESDSAGRLEQEETHVN